MKTTLLLIIFQLFLSSAIFAQTEDQDVNNESAKKETRLSIDTFYSNQDELLLVSGIHNFDNISQPELIKKFKNWASTNFVNLKEVIVSETDNQIVLNYISNAYYIKSLGIVSTMEWYVRLIVQFKDGRIKCSFYDDGNVAILPSRYGPGASARTIHFKNYFKGKDVEKFAPKGNTEGLLAFKKSVINTYDSIKTGIEKQSFKTDDW